MDLKVDSPAATASPERAGILHGLKRKLLKSHDAEEQRIPLERISNGMPANVTDCLLAPIFPGDIALFSVASGSTTLLDVERRRRLSTDDAPPDGKNARRRPQQFSATKRQRIRVGESGGLVAPRVKRGRTQNLIVVAQALVATGPEVTVSRLRDVSGGRGDSGGGGKIGQEPSTITATRVVGTGVGLGRFGGQAGRRQQGASLLICKGDGPVAIAGCGRLKRLRLKAGQKRTVDLTRAVGWTDDVSWTIDPARQGRSSGSKNGGSVVGPGSVTNFKGPGVVFIQTHSIAGLRRLFSRPPGAMLQSEASGFGGRRRRGEAMGAPIVDMGLSLKRGLAKRAKARVQAGARRVLLAMAFFGLYVAVYSVATALLLEGRDGLVKAPRHAVQVLQSLAKVVRRVALVLVRLGQEELWRNEGGRGSQESRGVDPAFCGNTGTEH